MQQKNNTAYTMRRLLIIATLAMTFIPAALYLTAEGSPLTVAIESGDFALVKSLLATGIDPNVPEAMAQAVRINDLSILTALLEAGADPNRTAALQMALSRHSWVMAKALLEAGAKPSHRTLRLSVIGQNREMTDLLLAHGAPPSPPAPPRVFHPYLYPAALCDAVHSNDLWFLQRLLEAGADPNGLDNNGDSALFLAATLEDDSKGKQAMQVLLAHGANPDNGGWDYDWGLEYTVMERLTLSNHHSSFLDEMKILLNAGANPHKALQLATYLGNFDVAHLIMNHVTGPRIERLPNGLIIEWPNERGKLWRRD